MGPVRTIVLIGIVIAAISAGLGVTYYYSIFLPAEKNRADLVEGQQQCLELQQKVLANYQKDYMDGNTSQATQATARNHFSQKLQKCYVEITETIEISSNSFAYYYYVFDAVENNPLFDCLFPSGGGVPTTCEDNRESKGSGKTISGAMFMTLENEYMKQ
jgi:hypothetical protein